MGLLGHCFTNCFKNPRKPRIRYGRQPNKLGEFTLRHAEKNLSQNATDAQLGGFQGSPPLDTEVGGLGETPPQAEDDTETSVSVSSSAGQYPTEADKEIIFGRALPD